MLSKEDLKGLKMLNTEQHSRFDILAQVCSVALKKFNLSKRELQQPQPPQSAKASKSKQSIKIGRKENNNNQHSLSSKRSRYGSDDDDWEINAEPKKIAKKSRKPKKIRRSRESVELVPDLPEILKRKINEMQGTEIALVIQKELTETDLSSNHNRLSMSFTRIREWGFLRDDEKAKLEAQEIIVVPLVEPEPEMRVTEMNLRQWDMRKKFGKKTSSSYVLRTAWLDVARRNGLLEDEVVQVWSFRVQARLHMALVVLGRLPRPRPDDAGAGSTSTGPSGVELVD